jgi:hypothetical protein
MVDQLHVHVHVKPCGRLREEPVGIRRDVPFSERGEEFRFETCRVQRR